MTEKEVRDIVKSTLKSQMSDVLTKADVKKIAQEEAKKVSKDSITQDDVRNMIKKSLLAYHKWMWEKKGLWMNQI